MRPFWKGHSRATAATTLPTHQDAPCVTPAPVLTPCAPVLVFPFPLYRLACALGLPALLLGCASMRDARGYYWQSAHGHAQLMQTARPLDERIAQPDTPPPAHAPAKLAQRPRLCGGRTACPTTPATAAMPT